MAESERNPLDGHFFADQSFSNRVGANSPSKLWSAGCQKQFARDRSFSCPFSNF
jgi:hypothetical protein